MSSESRIEKIIREKKTLFIIIAVGLFLIELEIFAVAAMKSGRESWLQVIDTQGNLVYETDGEDLSDFNKYYFEKNFGPLEQYKINLVKKDRPFPFRDWLVASIGIPIGITLLLGFIVKAYLSLFHGSEIEEERNRAKGLDGKEGGRFEKTVDSVSRFNIFVIGGLVFLSVIAYKAIPDAVKYIGIVGEETILRYRWFFLAILVALFLVMIWIIFLRYQLAKKTIDTQAEVEKHRIQLELTRAGNPEMQIEYKGSVNSEETPLVTWEEDAEIRHDK